MKSSNTRKLILSIVSLTMTTVCLTTTTFAWFAKNANAWTENFEVNLKLDEGLKISVNGTDYYDSVSKDEVVRAIVAKRNNVAYDSVTAEMIENFSFEFKSVSTKDLNSFTTIDEESKIVNKVYQPHEADNSYYAAFDLHFRAQASTSEPLDQYDLIFATDELSEGLGVTRVTGDVSYVKLNNSLAIPSYMDGRTGTREAGANAGKAYVLGEYLADDVLAVNPANAMRIGILHDKVPTIYELNTGYGSVALKDVSQIEESKKDLYDANKNPMLSYFNNTHTHGKMEALDYDSAYVNTEKNFDNKVSFGQFKRAEDGTYNDLTITVYLWLEGYDADYLEGVDASNVTFFMNFTKVGLEGTNETK